MVQSISIEDNILFGEPKDKEWYENAIKLCELDEDLKHLKYKDKTLIGEKGVKINDSMKIWISLARAVYADREIILMDNFLTALPLH